MAANARTATARKTPAARKKTPATRPPRTTAHVAPDVEPEEDFDDEDDAAEAQESEALGRYVTATLCGEELRILPPTLWRQSWNQMLNDGRTGAFAELAIHPDDFDRYEELDCTNQEFGEFIGEASEQVAESQGKSRGPNRSSRRTRRR